jgi:hypothetical protein
VNLEDLFMELVRRGAVAVNPVDLISVSVEEKQERCAGDAELAEDRFAGRLSPGGPVQDEVFFDELTELGIAVILLTQQFAAPSAA